MLRLTLDHLEVRVVEVEVEAGRLDLEPQVKVTPVVSASMPPAVEEAVLGELEQMVLEPMKTTEVIQVSVLLIPLVVRLSIMPVVVLGVGQQRGAVVQSYRAVPPVRLMEQPIVVPVVVVILPGALPSAQVEVELLLSNTQFVLNKQS
ncbi:MAG: hypothetical protein UU94_C0002G0002 [Candidatus Collierbacteria bacterium GW2011_GWB2_42_12]|nr:MAG: hypothetical protein UU94_C0002G0002 [Candidatus Collierbacteria bacterium GW2011_GWB2_42_12]